MNWTSDNAAALPKPKSTLLPILIALFLISYGLMALLVVEQGRTIDSQRNLIRSLFDDSTQLTQLKSKAVQKQHSDAQMQSQMKARSGTQIPSAKVPPAPSTQVPAQTPMAQDTPGNKNHAAGKARKVYPRKPPTGVADISDERRTANVL